MHSPAKPPERYSAQTVNAAVAHARLILARTSSSPYADAAILLAHVLGRERQWLIAHGDAVLSNVDRERFAALCQKRATGLPIAYITGFAGFYKREFAVNEHVLVPRPETEHLVDDIVTFLRERTIEGARGMTIFSVLDAGTGSGAIACSIAAEIPHAIVEGTDVSSDALEVARHNARRLNVQARCTFAYADVVRARDGKTYDAIVANLPYIPSDQMPHAPDPVAFEPRIALDGGADGLMHYRKLLSRAPRTLRRRGLLLMEAAPPTIGELERLTREAFYENADIMVCKDYAGLERYVRVLRA